MVRRALEIGTAVAAATAESVPVAFLTLTMRHTAEQPLETLWKALAKGWGAVTSGKYWQAAKVEYGLVGYVRVVEVTYGRNGWHVHVHALLFGEGIHEGNLDAVCRPMWNRWSRALQRAGLDAPMPHASEWHVVSSDWNGTALGEYLSKGFDRAGNLGAELTQTQSKVARSVHGTSSVWQLLEDGPVLGDPDAIQAWWEWEAASKGKRQIAWSRGLRERFGVGVEQSDEDIAGQEMGTVDDTLVWITREGWGQLVNRPWLLPELLCVAESEGAQGLKMWLISHEVGYELL